MTLIDHSKFCGKHCHRKRPQTSFWWVGVVLVGKKSVKMIFDNTEFNISTDNNLRISKLFTKNLVLSFWFLNWRYEELNQYVNIENHKRISILYMTIRFMDRKWGQILSLLYSEFAYMNVCEQFWKYVKVLYVKVWYHWIQRCKLALVLVILVDIIKLWF